MLAFRDVSIRVNGRVLFSDATFTLHQGQKVGLTGANGTGKSSIFRMLCGQLQPDTGEVSLPPQLALAHVQQEIPNDSREAIEFVLDGDLELRTIQHALEDAESGHDGIALARLHDRYQTIGGYEARARAGRLLAGLGFSAEDVNRSVNDFSGGWRMRLALARALMCRSDLLLLDEPTNHLDLEAVLWLQDWLASYSGTLLFVSHDRDFLDYLAGHILHIEQQTVTLYSGNYSAFEVTRAERLAQNQAAYERQQAVRAHLQSYVDRFRAKATKARQAQSRLKLLARMETIAQAHVDSPFRFAFAPPAKLPRPLLALNEASVGYNDKPLLENISMSLMPGDRLGLLGKNGAGKSTLIKLLSGNLPVLAGQRTPSTEIKLGYFAQYQLELLDPDASPLLHLQRLDARATEKELRGYLGGFDFTGDRALETVSGFSGGEKARLVLAMLIYQRPNLLLLDEPTNHLDLEMRIALIDALQDYSGALVVISHDSYLLRAVTDNFWLVHDQLAQPFEGDLDDYRVWLRNAERSSSPPSQEGMRDSTPVKSTDMHSRRETRKNEAERRQQLRPFRAAVETCEKQHALLSEQLNTLEVNLAVPELYDVSQKEQLKKLLAEKTGIERALAQAETAWLEASLALETAENTSN